jgi:hypothetical protein
MRTDKLFSLRNLDVLALLGFLVSHGFFREGVVYEAVSPAASSSGSTWTPAS